jgi:hypothetical protein
MVYEAMRCRGTEVLYFVLLRSNWLLECPIAL